jgi:hypothetical protein
MNDDTELTPDTTSDAELNQSKIEPAIPETPAEAPKPKRTTRAAKVARAVKPAKSTKPARARKADKLEETAAPAEEKSAKAVRPAKAARTVKSAKTAKITKPAKPVKAIKATKAATVAKTSKAAKPARSTKIAKSAATAIPKAPEKVATSGRGNGVRYTTNELNSAAKKAGLTVELTPMASKPVSIGRGPAKEFKIDVVVAHLRGSNGDLIRDRGPGTPFYDDAESLAAVAIFEKFRGKTFHKKLKVEIR